MKSQVSPGTVAIILNELQSGVSTSQQFPKLLKQFHPLIYSMAGRYSSNWQDDFAQEGMLGLYKAVNKFAASNVSSEKFISYATKSIRSNMTDFYKSIFGKSMVEVVEYSIDEGEQKKKKSIFCELPLVNTEPDESDDPFYHVASPNNYVTSTLLRIDFKYHFSKEGLTSHGFLQKEIAAFNLHFMNGYGVVEVAKQLNLSNSQASKIISKAQSKAQVILSTSRISKLNLNYLTTSKNYLKWKRKNLQD